MPYLKRINSLPLINHISYKYAQVSDIGPSWSSCFFLASTKIAQIIAMRSNLAPAWESQVLHGLIKGKLPNLPASSYNALAYQILHVALSGEPLQRLSKS